MSKEFQRALDAELESYKKIMIEQLNRPFLFGPLKTDNRPPMQGPPKPDWYEFELPSDLTYEQRRSITELIRRVEDQASDW